MTSDVLDLAKQAFSELFDSADTLAHIVGPDGRLTSVNDAWLRTLGYRRDEVIGRPIRELHTPESRERLLDDALALFRLTGAARSLACSLTRRDGGSVDLVADMETLSQVGPQGTSLSVISQDPSAWRTARTLLRGLVDLHHIARAIERALAPLELQWTPAGELVAVSAPTSLKEANATAREIASDTASSMHALDVACRGPDPACATLARRIEDAMRAIVALLDDQARSSESGSR